MYEANSRCVMAYETATMIPGSGPASNQKAAVTTAELIAPIATAASKRPVKSRDKSARTPSRRGSSKDFVDSDSNGTEHKGRQEGLTDRLLCRAEHWPCKGGPADEYNQRCGRRPPHVLVPAALSRSEEAYPA